MTDREAEQILDWLTGCFGKRLEENERMVWLSTLTIMEAGRAMQVALEFGKSGERFPSVPDFRRAMRPPMHSDDSWRDQPAEALPIPEYVSIWYWSICTRGQAHQPFPQFFPKPKDAMTDDEYQALREQWIEKGSPRIKSISDLMKGIST